MVLERCSVPTLLVSVSPSSGIWLATAFFTALSRNDGSCTEIRPRIVNSMSSSGKREIKTE